jgi:hypothetical protein
MNYSDDYDPFDHMTNNPVDFYTRGYGGFGYDTSHVKKDEPRSELFNQASAGNLSEVKRIVEGAENVSEEEKSKVINHAFDITLAALKGHEEVVQYLLEQGADPTLSGCPHADTVLDAFQAARGTRCNALLEAVKPFWERAKYAGVHYDAKSLKKFTNSPTDVNGMLRALRNA